MLFFEYCKYHINTTVWPRSCLDFLLFFFKGFDEFNFGYITSLKKTYKAVSKKIFKGTVFLICRIETLQSKSLKQFFVVKRRIGGEKVHSSSELKKIFEKICYILTDLVCVIWGTCTFQLLFCLKVYFHEKIGSKMKMAGDVQLTGTFWCWLHLGWHWKSGCYVKTHTYTNKHTHARTVCMKGDSCGH